MNDLNLNYCSFKSIIDNLNKKPIDEKFWNKERNNIQERIKDGKKNKNLWL